MTSEESTEQEWEVEVWRQTVKMTETEQRAETQTEIL